MKIGIIGAMPEEIELLKSKLENMQEETHKNSTCYIGTLLGKDIVLVKCGVGKVNAALITQFIITHYNVSHVINIGIAGSVTENINIGDTIISNDLVQHDVDARHFGYAYGRVPSMDTLYFKACEDLVKIASSIEGTTVGRIATGDQFVGDMSRKAFIHNQFNALCTEMEGAAIGHTCYVNDVPFIVIRSISDNASGNAFDEFTKNMNKTIEISTGIVEKLVEKI